MKKLYRVSVISILVFFIIIYSDYISASSLSVSLEDMSTGASSSSSSVTFNNHTTATQSSPWVTADQYLHVEFDSDYSSGYWGLRIVTDNLSDIIVDSDGDGVAEDEPAGTDDGSGNMSYSGIINVTLDGSGNITSISDDPAMKVILSWQAYNQDDSTTIVSITAPAVSDSDGDSIYTDDNVSTNWYEGDWAYIGDKSDSNSSGDAVLWTDSDGNTVVNYNVVAYGIYTYWFFRWIVPHPEDPDPHHTGDMEDRHICDQDDIDAGGDGRTATGWDIYVFLAGRFWNTGYYDYDGDGTYTASYFQLPAGDYRTNVYIELFYE